ncbi:putative inorganic phosphate transporter 1-4 [Platanthera guangdongensis]|uniref:Inorganic phosphate transporter 1-4 n=1 Tax=Platanthera guangdongensis TaxID=2320717 RepID=A0ABR2M421_9ASPA
MAISSWDTSETRWAVKRHTIDITLKLMVLCSLTSRLSFGHTAKSVITTLCFFRFWLSFGVGGEYSLSATIVSECGNKKTHGTFIAVVLATQGFSNLVGGIVTIIIFVKFKGEFGALNYKDDLAARSTVPRADFVWRIILIGNHCHVKYTFYDGGRVLGHPPTTTLPCSWSFNAHAIRGLTGFQGQAASWPLDTRVDEGLVGLQVLAAPLSSRPPRAGLHLKHPRYGRLGRTWP